MEAKLTLSQRKRAAIVETAILEFKDKGFQAVSMDSLSARAGVSKRTVYNHFESKEMLFREIARQLFDVSSQMTCLTYQPDKSLKKQLYDFAQRELQLLQQERFRSLAKIVFAESIHSPELVSVAMEQFEGNEQGLDTWIRAAIADGKLKPVDCHYAAAQFLGLIKSVAFWPQLLKRVAMPSEAECEQIAKDAVAMFLSRYRQR